MQPEIYFFANKTLTLDLPILRPLNQVYTLTTYLPKSYLNITFHLRQAFLRGY
jgi:hypothetical protein